MATFKAIILKGANHIKMDGTTRIKIRITHNRAVSYVSTDLYVVPKCFNNRQGTVRSGDNKDYINLRITDYIRKYMKIDIGIGDLRDSMSVTVLREHLISDKKNKPIDFFEFVNEFRVTVINEGTREQYDALVASLKSFAGDKLSVSQINLQFLHRYEQFLRNRGVKNGIINYMRTFRSLFNKARLTYNDEDIGMIMIPQYPFARYKLPKRNVKSKEHNLTIVELKVFMNYKPENIGEEFAKDMFLLMFYLIGIEAKDLFYLQKPKKNRIQYVRFKTERDYTIKLESEAIRIINKYKGSYLLLSVSERFQLHKSFTRSVNDYLHGEKAHEIIGIFPKLKIDKRVTTKWARHTWATIARNSCRIDKSDVALCLGHEDSDNRVTDIYVDYDYTIIDDSNRKVIDFVNSHGTSLDVTLDNK